LIINPSAFDKTKGTKLQRYQIHTENSLIQLKISLRKNLLFHCFLISALKFNIDMETGAEKGYGGCEGPDAMYVKLISSDGHEFIVKREHALTSGTIKGEQRDF
jgi:hypothetical protein